MKAPITSSVKITTKIALVMAALLVSGLGLFGPGITAFASTHSAATYSNVQISIAPQNSSLSIFSLTVYNSTGGVVASSESVYPAFSFQLPEGSYLFTATASSSNGYNFYPPIVYGASSSTPAVIYPKYYGYQDEYGYASVQVNSSSTSLSISTTELSSMPSSQVTIVAKYTNGTAADGASVYASVIGDDDWYYPASTLAMNNQTGPDGSATLTVPDVPLDVTVWSWVQVNLPQSQITTQVTVAGQPVNVTAYWQPTYIGVAGSVMLFPPFQQTSITLKAQQQNFWAYPQGVVSTPSGVAVPGVESAGSAGTAANSPTAIPASVQAQEAGAPSSSPSNATPVSTPPSTVTVTSTSTASPTGSTTSNDVLFESGILVAVIIAVAAAVLSLRKK
jgi:hypothetical protein